MRPREPLREIKDLVKLAQAFEDRIVLLLAQHTRLKKDLGKDIRVAIDERSALLERARELAHDYLKQQRGAS